MRSGLLSMFLLSLVATAATPQTQLHELIARARSLELDTPYVPPPGDPLAHHAAGYAKVMCTSVFMTGLAPDFAAEMSVISLRRMRCGRSSVGQWSTAPTKRFTSHCRTV
jgi:hypothetical protein